MTKLGRNRKFTIEETTKEVQRHSSSEYKIFNVSLNKNIPFLIMLARVQKFFVNRYKSSRQKFVNLYQK
jgi:hypothetical protein